MAGKKRNTMQQQEQNPPEQSVNGATMQIMQATIDAAKQSMEKDRIARFEGENKEHDPQISEAAKNPETQLNNIGVEEIKEAFDILNKYRQEKAELEARIGENEEFWKLNHWNVVYSGQQEDADKRVKPRSAWLFNMIINKHADAMDNFPEANILPRARDDEDVAKTLSQIIPVILEQNNYEKTYSDCQWYKEKNGTSVQGVFWNNELNNGVGDVEVRKVDLLNLYFKGGLDDIQDSPNVFQVTMMDNDEIKLRYPEIELKGGNILGLESKNIYKQNVDTTEQTPVIDWYYKKRIETVDDLGVKKTKTVLHYCKFCSEQIIYASENDPKYAESGWYDHGLYPYVFDVLFPIENSVCGMGFIDVEKDDQIYIDKLNQAILENAIVNARPRYATTQASGLNEEEFTDLSKAIIHLDRIDDSAFRPIVPTQLSGIYESVYLNKIQEMKDTSGNTASSQGQTSSVTSASGIVSLQEAAGKLSRDSNAASYRAFKQVVNIIIELIRQFYNEPRCFRIVGQNGHNEYTTFDNSGLVPQEQGSIAGIDLGDRLPIMDIDVKPQKKNAYSKEAQNQTAINLYNMGFFAPNNSDAALACMDMMNFDNIEKVKDNVRANGTMFNMIQQLQQQLIQLAGVIDAQQGTNIAEQVAQQAGMNMNSLQQQMGGGSINTSKGSLSSQAASATRGSTSPS